MNFDDRRGFTLAETVVSIALIIMVWIGVVNIVVLGKSIESRARHKVQAIHAAGQVIEDVRKWRWDKIVNTTLPSILIDDNGTPYSYLDDVNGTAIITVTPNSPNPPNVYYKKVLVDVQWKELRTTFGAQTTMHEYCGTNIANDAQAN